MQNDSLVHRFESLQGHGCCQVDVLITSRSKIYHQTREETTSNADLCDRTVCGCSLEFQFRRASRLLIQRRPWSTEGYCAGYDFTTDSTVNRRVKRLSCISIRMQQLGFRRTKFDDSTICQVSFKSDQNNRYFTGRPMQMYNIYPNASYNELRYTHCKFGTFIL